MMLVAVVGVFLLVEFPLAVLVIVLMVDNTFNLDLLDARRRDVCEQLVNFFILLSYPINFFIYCGMSQQFRETFCGLFAPGQCFSGSSQPEETIIEGMSPKPGTRTAALTTAKLDDIQLTYVKLTQDDEPAPRDTEAVANDAV